jgi:hypothetical protein
MGFAIENSPCQGELQKAVTHRWRPAARKETMETLSRVQNLMSEARGLQDWLVCRIHVWDYLKVAGTTALSPDLRRGAAFPQVRRMLRYPRKYRRGLAYVLCAFDPRRPLDAARSPSRSGVGIGPGEPSGFAYDGNGAKLM